MYEGLGHVTLATGEQVDIGVVICPDVEWAERLVKFLYHKGNHWNWQTDQFLRENIGIDTRFYVLHRGGIPLANITTAELSGVGILGHVWTNSEDREKGACTKLMNVQMKDFKSRQGRALFLGTDYDSVAYHIYARFGFSSVESGSGFMEWYATSRSEFQATFYKKAKTTIQPIGWIHWPSSPALFLGDFPCVIRCVPLKIIGRHLTEGPLLPLLRDEKKRKKQSGDPHAMVLRNEGTTAVVGLTTWDWHPLWEDTCLVDIFCHPDYWSEAGSLLKSLPLPEAERYIAYGDIDCKHKTKVLLDDDFRQTTILKRRVRRNMKRNVFLDVRVFEKGSSVAEAAVV
jgi:hypothetical protein